MSFVRTITQSGVQFAHSKSDKRNIILTNYISLVSAAATLLLLISRFAFAYVNPSVLTTLLPGVALFLLPVLLNRLGWYNLSRLGLCWIPGFYQLYGTIRTMNDVLVFESSTYVGLRFFALAFSCFPFLVFDLRKNKGIFIIALLGPVLSLLLYDPILNALGLGYRQVGLQEATYEFNNVRVLVAFLIIGSSSFFLKKLLEDNESLNEELIVKLEEKTRIIQEQASQELTQLNEQLMLNLEQLREREFLLNQSQRVAKMGSWEYHIRERSLFWSDEMYTVFALASNYTPTFESLSSMLWPGEGGILDAASRELFLTGKPYDLTLRATTPLGYVKWVRICAFPIHEHEAIIGARGICHDVTFYKEAEEQIRKNEKKYYSLFEQASDPIITSDLNGIITDVNASLCKTFGYEKRELIGKHITQLMDQQQLAELPLSLDRVLAGDQVFSSRSMVQKNGSIVEVEANVKKFGETGVMAIVRDVTELRRAQKQLQISEARLRGAFEYSATGMALVSTDGKLLKVNRELCNIMGYSEDELLKQSMAALAFHEDLEKDVKLFGKCIQGELETYRLEKRYLHKNGSIIWINQNVSLVRDSQSSPLYFVAQLEDITKEKEALDSLIVSQANLNATINNTEILIWSVDREFKILTFNKPFAQYIRERYGVEVETGRRVTDMMRPEDRHELKAKWTELYFRGLAGEVVTLEESRPGRDFKYSISPIIENTKVIGVSVFADNVTERNARDRELAEAQVKIGELKLMALRSVMNPHFIFNVLNSIQYFIAQNDRLNAINYLSTFSKLIRSILNHSLNNRIKLADEIEMLKNYVQLEMTRFENKFDFILHVDPELDTDDVELPSLLIQPYVENAILHGLYNKRSHGKLQIRFTLDHNLLNIVIEDDGIGRHEAMKLRKEHFPVHKSMGLHLTEERLRLINNQNKVLFNIEDLETDGVPRGPRVTIGVNLH